MSEVVVTIVYVAVAVVFAAALASSFLGCFVRSISRHRRVARELNRRARIKAKVLAGNIDQEVYEVLGKYLDIDPYSLAAWREQIKLPGPDGKAALDSFRALAAEKLVEHSEWLDAEIERGTEHKGT